MKYCLKCGKIISDKSIAKDREVCRKCNIPLNDDGVTGDQFEALSDLEKEQYTEKLYTQIKQSEIFNETLSCYGKPSFYFLYWFDKYEELEPGWEAGRYETPEDLSARMERKYGVNSKAYQEELVNRCIQQEREKKAQARGVPKCPTCQSTNIHKITATSKVTNTVLFGIFGTKRHKTFHCDSCGYEW